MIAPLTTADCLDIATRADSMMDHGGERDEAYEAKLKALAIAAWALRAHIA